MADAGPNYSVERRRQMLQKMEHQQGISKGKARISEIENQKEINVARVELQNDELDSEVQIIRANEAALLKAIGEIDKRLSSMVKGSDEG